MAGLTRKEWLLLAGAILIIALINGALFVVVGISLDAAVRSMAK